MYFLYSFCIQEMCQHLSVVNIQEIIIFYIIMNKQEIYYILQYCEYIGNVLCFTVL